MDIICASICYRGYADDEVAATLRLAPAIGYRQLEIHGPMLWSVEAVEAFDLPAVQRMIAASGMQCAGLYPPAWGGREEEDVRRRARAIARCVGFAEALGATHISTTGASPRGEPQALDRVSECVRQVLEMVPADSPVKLTLEPHWGNVLQEPEDFERILDDFPDRRLGACVDTGHFHSARVDTVAFIRSHAARIYAVHFKDHVGTVSVGIGRGEINLQAVVQVLREIRYHGGLTIELEVQDPQNLPRYTAEAYIYTSGLLGTKL